MGMKQFFYVVLMSVLVFSATANQTESPPNGSSFDPDGPIAFNEVLTGGLPGGWPSDPTPDWDYWQFSGVSGQTYKFTGVPKNTLVESLYIGMDIENSSAVLQATKSADTPNQTVVLEWTCTVSGTYYLIVWEATLYQNGTAYYEITCEQYSSVDDW
ncbi:hypothetical protein JW926_16500, partial [Candidatus Sumerlaeota bacterium]|nr:hypothetical protein [Candidatus Sumerlaeota bacterium]